MSDLQTALIIGATGLVGSQLLQLLLEDDSFPAVHIFVRRETELRHPKLIEHVVDFDQPETWHSQLQGDVLFSALGTTIRKAGGQAAQYRVDYTYQYEAARAAADNGVRQFVLISSAGADVKSAFFYSRMKGELDRDIGQLPFEVIRIIKPSVLDGKREETRIGESVGLALGKILAPLIPPLRKYRPIHAKLVAQAMIRSLVDSPTVMLKQYEFQEVFDLAQSE